MNDHRYRLLVFSDDWGRHPSSCQYLVRELLDRAHVTWVNTIGMRPPRLDRATVNRVLGKLQAIAQRRSPAPEETTRLKPAILEPLMWPWFTRKHDRWLNQRLLSKRLAAYLAQTGQRTIAITTIPIVADLVHQLPVERWIYYCVDDFSVWPGLDQATMLTMERELVARVDGAVAASPVLADRLLEMGKPSMLLTHGVDVDHWSQTKQKYAWSNHVREPVALFWGVVDQRLDMQFLRALSAQHAGSIVLVGPQQEPPSELASLPNVHLLPPVSTSTLAAMAHSAHCLIMPYCDAPVTRAMQPLKLKEYLATGQPVVARRLPATQVWDDSCDLVDDAEAFAKATAHRFHTRTPVDQLEHRRRLQNESWLAKAEQFWNYVTQESATPNQRATGHKTSK